MTEKELDFVTWIEQMGEGEYLTIARVAKALGVHRDTAHRYLARAVGSGKLITHYVHYRRHITQTLYAKAARHD